MAVRMEQNRIIGFIQGHRVSLLVDTGASVSCVSLPFLAKLKTPPNLMLRHKQVSHVRGVNGDLLKVVGSIELPVKIQGLILYHTFTVLATLYTPVILGLDFLEEHEASIDLKDKTLTLKDGIACVSMLANSQCGKATVAKNISIPPMTQCIVPVKLPTQYSNHTAIVMLEPMDSLLYKYNLLGSKCVVQASATNMVPYLLINPTNETVKLTIGTPLVAVDIANEILPYNDTRLCSSIHTHNDIDSGAATKVLHDLGIDFSGSQELTRVQHDKLAKLIALNRKVFAKDLSELGCCDLHSHRIETGDAKPIPQRFYRQTPKARAETRRQIQEMLENNIIEPSTSEWQSPIVLVAKAQGYRFAVDYRKLNSVTQPMTFPLPRIDDLMDSVGESGATIFSTLDLRSGFHQIKLDPETAHKTAFITPEGVYQYKRLPFGLRNAPMSFQMVMSQIFRSMTYKNVLVYIDDLLVYSKDFETHLEDLQEVFERLTAAKLKLSPSKCSFAAKSIKYLGHIINKDGIQVNPDKAKVLLTYPTPKNAKDLRSFLGSCNYFRRFIKDYAARAAPLTTLLKSETRFVWTEKCQSSFDDLKQALTSPPILVYPDFNKMFSLSADASGTAIGYVLEQADDQGRMRAVAYGGRALRTHERKWSITELECLAVIEGIRCYHHFLANNHFTIFTDHAALKWLQNIKLSAGRLARWSLLLQGYSFTIFHRPGRQNKIADALSRRPYEPQQETIPEKPDLLVSTIISECETLTQALIEYDDNSVTTELPVNAVESADPHVTMEQMVLTIGDDLRTAQNNSPDFRDIIQYLETRELPNDSKLAQRILAESQYYVIVDDILYHLYYHGSRGVPRPERLVKQLAVPETYRQRALEAYHDALAGGSHSGIERTYHHLRLKYYWPKMYKDVYEHVHTCHECQQAKRDYQAKPAPLQPLPIGDIFSRWHIDILGPLPQTAANERYVLVLVDSFTKWCEAYPLKTQSSAEIKQALFDTFARYGAPACLVSDRGANFLSKMVAALCELFNVKRVHTSAYHPQTNATVERMNAVIAQGIRVYLDEHQERWSTFLPGILMAYRSAPATQSTKYSPYFMVFGREMMLPIDVALLPKTSMGINAQEHIREILENLESTRKIARDNMEEAQKRYKDRYDRSVKKPTFQIGDQVLVYNPHTPKGKVSKLMKKWTGPYYITQHGPNHTFKIRLCADNKAYKCLIHANRLKPYFGRESQDSKESEHDVPPIHDADASPTPASQDLEPSQPLQRWHAVEKILACKRRGQDVLYKVKWANTRETDWVNSRDITDAAKQEFHNTRTASGKIRKKPLQRHKFFTKKN